MKTVEITIEGGMVSDVKLPKGVKVIVKDYDCCDIDPDDMPDDVKKDKDGELYAEAIYED